MKIFMKEIIKIINFRERVLISGKVGQPMLDSSKMERGMGMEFGNQDGRIMIYTKVNIQMITNMEMEFINGQMEQSIKDRLKMI